MALSLAMMALIEPGDEVLFPIRAFDLSVVYSRAGRDRGSFWTGREKQVPA